jgi:hypothetical protein
MLYLCGYQAPPIHSQFWSSLQLTEGSILLVTGLRVLDVSSLANYHASSLRPH